MGDDAVNAYDKDTKRKFYTSLILSSGQYFRNSRSMDNNLIDIFSGKYGLEREAASELLGQMDSVSFRKGEAVVDISCCNSRIPRRFP